MLWYRAYWSLRLYGPFNTGAYSARTATTRAVSDSFEMERDYLLDCAYYTRPEEYRGLNVPEVLLSGNHKEIDKWRKVSSRRRTEQLRPDLLNGKN